MINRNINEYTYPVFRLRYAKNIDHGLKMTDLPEVFRCFDHSIDVFNRNGVVDQ